MFDYKRSKKPTASLFPQRIGNSGHSIDTSWPRFSKKIGNKKAIRAVGAANGANPIVIFTPCHRIVGKAGKLVGYAGGLERKAWLIKLEKKITIKVSS